jgi:hypothetical protein
MKDKKRREIFLKEQADSQTARRNKNQYQSRFKKLKVIKIILIILFALCYFLYSPMLLFLCVAYAMLLFYARSIERTANRNLPKRLHISILKFDSVIAFFLILTTAISVTVISFSGNKTQSSMFADKSTIEIRAELKEKGMTDSQIDEMISRIKQNASGVSQSEKESGNVTDNLFTLCVGKWELFSQKSGSTLFSSRLPQFQGGKNAGVRIQNGENAEGSFSLDHPIAVMRMPEGFSPPDDGIRVSGAKDNFISRSGKSGVLSLASQVPFSEAFSQAMLAVNSLLLIIMIIIGILSMKERYKKDV